MKKILLFIVALVATLSMNAQTTEIYKGTAKEATYSGADVRVEFGTSGSDRLIKVYQGKTLKGTYTGSEYKVVSKELPPTTGTAKRKGNVDVNWVQLWKDGPKFAEYNVGAKNNKATDYGYYLVWGGHEDKESAYYGGSAVLSGSDDSAYNLWGEHWRMPTLAEINALMSTDKCSTTWYDGQAKKYNNTTVPGYLITGKGDYSSNSIFLPAAGNYAEGRLSSVGSIGRYWSSAPNGSDANQLYISNNTFMSCKCERYTGCSIRPIYVEEVVAVTGVSLNKTELKVGVGNTETLSATVAPENATNKKVKNWASSDKTVATVDAYGKVKGVALGQCTITVTTEDGEKTATCTVNVVKPTTGYAKATIGGKDVEVKWIQLWENGPKFAEYNVGVTDGKKSSKGDCYEWSSNIVSNNWGTNWRMPTGDELKALIANCEPGWTKYGGPYDGFCLTFTGKSEDYKNNEIAFPATGYYLGSLFQGVSQLFYWSSTVQNSTADVLWGCHDWIGDGIGETYQMDTMGTVDPTGANPKCCVRAVLNEPK